MAGIDLSEFLPNHFWNSVSQLSWTHQEDESEHREMENPGSIRKEWTYQSIYRGNQHGPVNNTATRASAKASRFNERGVREQCVKEADGLETFPCA